ncbi:MAG: tetraacyldisaccharide 4'-kinase [Nitrospirales bacterium]|nr:tetraacyldisaccharide 4'-kinase [Nitrospirales bacterium]
MQQRLSSILNVLRFPYGIAVKARLWLYENQWIRSKTLPKPVISIGNLTVGGTGKTPMTIWLAQWLASKGWKVGVLSRGYRRRSRETQLLASNFHNILVEADQAGDEPFLLAQRCPGICVAVGADRYRLGQWVLDQYPVDVFVLDDGFQHLGISRDMNILLIDASDPEGLQQLLPAGRLREPLLGAARATVVILTRADTHHQQHDVLAPIRTATGKAFPCAITQFRPEYFLNISNGTQHPISSIQGKRVLLVSGIGNPSSFRRNMIALGPDHIDEYVFPDHHTYSSNDLAIIRQHAQCCATEIILTTEKDAVKIQPLLEPCDEIWSVRLGIQFLEGLETLEMLLTQTLTTVRKNDAMMTASPKSS